MQFYQQGDEKYRIIPSQTLCLLFWIILETKLCWARSKFKTKCLVFKTLIMYKCEEKQNKKVLKNKKKSWKTRAVTASQEYYFLLCSFSLRFFFEGKEKGKRATMSTDVPDLGCVTSCPSRGRCLWLAGKCRVRLLKTSQDDPNTRCVISSHGEALLPKKQGKRLWKTCLHEELMSALSRRACWFLPWLWVGKVPRRLQKVG